MEGMPKRKKSLSEFVRDYLDQHGTAYVAEMHRAHAEFCEKHGYPPTSYEGVRGTIWTLKQLGLIEQSHSEPVAGGNIEPRNHYRLTPGALESDWSDPRGRLYGRS